MDWLAEIIKQVPGLEQGGWMMIPIYFCSFLTVGFFFERLLALRRKYILPENLMIELSNLIERGRLEDALLACRGANSPMAKIVEKGLESAEEGREIIRDAMTEAGRQQAALLNRNLGVLGTVAGVAPLLGLLGTVSGMISTFTAIRQMGVGHAEELSGGISEALLSTAAGLSVAIPAMIAFRFLQGRVARLVLEMEDKSFHLAEMIAKKGALAGQSGDEKK